MSTSSPRTVLAHARTALSSAAVIAATLTRPVTAHADPPRPRAFVEPPHVQIARPAAPRTAAALEAVAPAGPGPLEHEARFDLDVVYRDGAIWNPATQSLDRVKLRSYRGTGVPPDAPFVGPVIDILPGETVRMTLHNKLPFDPSCINNGNNLNVPHCFNGTNLHTHGLWVNPAGNSDNVLLSVNPGVSFEYEYNIPADHPAGTFWYHTHRHGSTALQVSSGMAGALIVRGTRLPGPGVRGDLDTLLRVNGKTIAERVLVLQQIQYACRDAQGNIKVNPDGSYRCEPRDVGGVEGYDQFGPGSWPQSGRFTTINGEVMPEMAHVQAGVVERWRLVHAGVRDSIRFQIRRLRQGSPSTAALRAGDVEAFIAANCIGPPLPYHVVAADGLTTARALRRSEVTLQPGYRYDALVMFPDLGDYCVLDEAAPPPANVGQTAASRRLLATVVVDGGTPVRDVTQRLTAALIEMATATMPPSMVGAVVADLKDGLKLTSFVPHRDIADREVTGKQSLVFNIDVRQTPVVFEVNGKSYAPDQINRTLRLWDVDEWTLQSQFVSHPFHIHVNPFQIVRVLDPAGKDVSADGAIDNYGLKPGEPPDTQYAGSRGMWKDTLWVKSVSTDGGKTYKPYTIVVRTRYERYIGDFVLHCHILDHEDQGMMQNVRIALPDGSGGVSLGHH